MRIVATEDAANQPGSGWQSVVWIHLLMPLSSWLDSLVYSGLLAPVSPASCLQLVRKQGSVSSINPTYWLGAIDFTPLTVVCQHLRMYIVNGGVTKTTAALVEVLWKVSSDAIGSWGLYVTRHLFWHPSVRDGSHKLHKFIWTLRYLWSVPHIVHYCFMYLFSHSCTSCRAKVGEGKPDWPRG